MTPKMITDTVTTMLRAMRAALIIATVLALTPSMAVAGWNTKAMSDERAASRSVGGFSTAGARLYHNGLQHLYHTHQRPGAFTISQVVEQERARETARARTRVSSGPAHYANAGNENGGRSIGALWIFLLLFFGLILFACSRRPQVKTEPSTPLDDKLYRLGALTPISPGNVLPFDGETFYWACDAKAVGPIHNRQYVRGTSGVSVRVARGVTLRTSGSRGHYVDDVRVGVVDHGRLMLSNMRLLFIGSGGGVAYIGFRRIIAVEALDRGLRVLVDKGEPQAYETGSTREVTIIRRLIAGDIDEHRAPHVDDAPQVALPLAASGGVAALSEKEKAAAVMQRIAVDRVIVAQQRAAGSMTESQYASAMRELDALAAEAGKWT